MHNEQILRHSENMAMGKFQSAPGASQGAAGLWWGRCIPTAGGTSEEPCSINPSHCGANQRGLLQGNSLSLFPSPSALPPAGAFSSRMPGQILGLVGVLVGEHPSIPVPQALLPLEDGPGLLGVSSL